MIKLFNRYLPLRMFVFAELDALCIFLVTVVYLYAEGYRTGWSPTQMLFIALLNVAISIPVFYFFDLYDFDLPQRTNELLFAGLRAGSGIAICLIPLSIFLLHMGARASYLEIGLVASIMLALAYRLVYARLYSHIVPGQRILLIGRGPLTALLARRIEGQKCLPLRLVGILKTPDTLHSAGTEDAYKSHLDSLMRVFRPDRVAVDHYHHEALVSPSQLIELRQHGVLVEDLLVLYEAITARVPVDLLQERDVAYGPSLSLTSRVAFTSRILDVFIATIFFLATWPLFLLIAICIRLDSAGPVFYTQERVGLHNSLFHVIKFRSMRTDAEADSGPVWALEHDSRVTRCGKLLRKLRMDEFPQMWNILRGEMSLVGPRPERMHFVKTLNNAIPYYNLRHCVRPGLTGWAQVCAPYGASVDDARDKLEYDLFYLKNRSLLFNGLILLKTVKVCVFGRGAR